MNKVKYQIFVSSTYEDLKEERDQVIKACLEMGHIPVGMEMFSAADEEQWKIITRQIDESDYYVIIVANRYGSIVDGISYTEKEYDYAISKGIPVLGFVLDSGAGWPSNRTETGEEARVRLDAFKKKVKAKPVNFWTSKDDLHGKCAVALMKTFNTQPRPGWVRSPDAIGPEVASELSRLSSENAKLTSEVTALRKAANTSNLAQGKDRVELSFQRNRGQGNTITVSTTWDELFVIITNQILDNPKERRIQGAICSSFYKQIAKKYDDSRPIAISDVERQWLGFELLEKDLDRIRTQFLALRLIQVDQIEYKKPEYETFIAWKLTSNGTDYYANLLAERRQINVNSI